MKAHLNIRANRRTGPEFFTVLLDRDDETQLALREGCIDELHQKWEQLQVVVYHSKRYSQQRSIFVVPEAELNAALTNCLTSLD